MRSALEEIEGDVLPCAAFPEGKMCRYLQGAWRCECGATPEALCAASSAEGDPFRIHIECIVK